MNGKTGNGARRITLIDALRGFALLGVVLVHMQQHYSIFNFGGPQPGPPAFPEIDRWIGWFTREALMGKFINIFAFLFGMSFFIQMDRAAKRGVDFRPRFVWRMAVLFVIGIIGSIFYSGDILSFYAVFGLVLTALYPLRNKAMMLLVCIILLGAPRWISYGYGKYRESQREKVEAAAPAPAQGWTRGFGDWKPEPPSFVKSVKDNLTTGRERTFNYQFGFFGRGYLTMAMFILGLVVGRTRFFETVGDNMRRNLLLFLLFCGATWIVGLADSMIPAQRGMFWGTQPSEQAVVKITLGDIRLVTLSAAITMGFVLLYHLRGVGKALNVLSPYGRMGLTNYTAQGVVGSAMFSLWGFGGFFGTMHATSLLAVGLVFYTVQVVLSALWLKYFQYGPLEWLWRSATYLEWQPMLKARRKA